MCIRDRGSPTLYATTRAFLEKFGLRSVADLPDLDQFAPDDDTRAFIRERLSAPREPCLLYTSFNTSLFSPNSVPWATISPTCPSRRPPRGSMG